MFKVTEGHGTSTVGERACAGPCNAATVYYVCQCVGQSWTGEAGLGPSRWRRQDLSTRHRDQQRYLDDSDGK